MVPLVRGADGRAGAARRARSTPAATGPGRFRPRSAEAGALAREPAARSPVRAMRRASAGRHRWLIVLAAVGAALLADHRHDGVAALQRRVRVLARRRPARGRRGRCTTSRRPRTRRSPTGIRRRSRRCWRRSPRSCRRMPSAWPGRSCCSAACGGSAGGIALVALALVAFLPVAVELRVRNVHLRHRRARRAGAPTVAGVLGPGGRDQDHAGPRASCTSPRPVGGAMPRTSPSLGLVVLGVSVALGPGAWREFIDVVGVRAGTDGGSLLPIPFAIRFAAGAALAVIAGLLAAGRIGGGQVLAVWRGGAARRRPDDRQPDALGDRVQPARGDRAAVAVAPPARASEPRPAVIAGQSPAN